jgi:hypothetical protein
MTKRLIITSFILLAFSVVFVLFITPFLNNSIKNKQYNHIQTEKITLDQFDQESDRLEEFLKTFKDNPSILKNLQIRNSDTLGLTTLLFTQSIKNNIDSLTITDGRGVVLARTSSQTISGDYLFDTTQYGKLLSEGKEVKIIGYELEGAKLSILVGLPIINNDKIVIGSIVATREINKNFLQEKILPLLNKDLHIAVYDQENGIETSTYSDSEQTIIENTLVEIVKNLSAKNTSLGTILLKEETPNLYNFAFSKLKYQSFRGGLIFFVNEIKSIQIYNILALVIFFLLLFITSLVYILTGWYLKLKTKEILSILSLILSITIIIYVLNIFFDHSKNIKPLNDNVYSIYNSTIHLNPASGLFDKNFGQSIDIVVKSGGEPINVAKAEIVYDPKKIRIEDIMITDTFCEPGFIIERMIDNENGLVKLSCGTRIPFQGNQTTLATLVMQPLEEGNIQLEFTDKTAIYAHDGLGTDVLRQKNSANYQIIDSELTDKLLLFSRSHPNSSKWYNEPDAIFSWRGPQYKEYRYILSEEILDKLPDNATVTNKNEAIVNLPRDGEYYFYLQSVGSDKSIYTLKIKNDQSAPLAPEVRVSESEVEAGQLIRMEFDSQDEISGIEKPYHYVSFNKGTFFPVQSPLFTSLPETGQQVITIRVFDNAGNYNETSKIINVKNSIKNSTSVILSNFYTHQVDKLFGLD